LADNWAASNWPAKKTAAGTPGRKNDNFSPKLPPLVTSVEIVLTHPGPRPNTALLESWAATLARSVVAGQAATIAVEDDAARDVRIVTRWPIAGDPDARITAHEVPLT